METVLLKSMSFNSFETHAKLTAEVNKETLSYWTTFILNVIDVNKLLNLLQKNNESVDIYDFMKSKEFSDFTEYSFDFTDLIDCQMEKSTLEFLLNFQSKKQIRA